MREELEDELEGAGELRLVLLEEPLGEVVLMRVFEDPEERTLLLTVVWEELLEGLPLEELLLDERELLPEGAALVLELLLEGVAEEDLVLDEVVDLEPVLEDVEVAGLEAVPEAVVVLLEELEVVEVADLEPVPDAGAVAVLDLEPVVEEVVDVADLEELEVAVVDLEPVPDAGAVAVVALDPVLPELAVADRELDVAALTLSLRSRAFAALTCEEPKLSLAGTSG